MKTFAAKYRFYRGKNFLLFVTQVHNIKKNWENEKPQVFIKTLKFGTDDCECLARKS